VRDGDCEHADLEHLCEEAGRGDVDALARVLGPKQPEDNFLPAPAVLQAARALGEECMILEHDVGPLLARRDRGPKRRRQQPHGHEKEALLFGVLVADAELLCEHERTHAVVAVRNIVLKSGLEHGVRARCALLLLVPSVPCGQKAFLCGQKAFFLFWANFDFDFEKPQF
jgi:hypothetical protein